MPFNFDIEAARKFQEEKFKKKQDALDVKFREAKRDFEAICNMIISEFHPVAVYQWGSLLDRTKFSEISEMSLFPLIWKVLRMPYIRSWLSHYKKEISPYYSTLFTQEYMPILTNPKIRILSMTGGLPFPPCFMILSLEQLNINHLTVKLKE